MTPEPTARRWIDLVNEMIDAGRSRPDAEENLLYQLRLGFLLLSPVEFWTEFGHSVPISETPHENDQEPF